MKSLTILKTVVLSTLIFSACQPTTKKEDSSETAKAQNNEIFDDRDDEKDADFIVTAVAANLAEINLAHLYIYPVNSLESLHNFIRNESLPICQNLVYCCLGSINMQK